MDGQHFRWLFNHHIAVRARQPGVWKERGHGARGGLDDVTATCPMVEVHPRSSGQHDHHVVHVLRLGQDSLARVVAPQFAVRYQPLALMARCIAQPLDLGQPVHEGRDVLGGEYDEFQPTLG